MFNVFRFRFIVPSRLECKLLESIKKPGGGGGGGGARGTLCKYQYRDALLTWVGFSVTDSQICIDI